MSFLSSQSQFKPPSVTCVDGLLTCFPWRERHSGTHSRSILPAPVGCTEPRPASHLSEHASDLEANEHRRLDRWHDSER